MMIETGAVAIAVWGERAGRRKRLGISTNKLVSRVMNIVYVRAYVRET